MTPAALDLALPTLRCPVGGEALHRDERTLRCTAGHAFDVARQGHVSLLAGSRPHHGDTAPMVEARERFLGAGHYTAVADIVTAAAVDGPPGPVLDLAGGTGWYLARVLEAQPDRVGITLDVSVPALRRAARAHPRLAAVGADAWGRLPVADGTVGVVLSVFGPRDAAEVGRVLAPEGLLVAVTPTPAHLAEVVGPLGMLGVGRDKPARLRAAFADLEPVAYDRVEAQLTLDHPALVDLALMGPAGHHRTAADLAAAAESLPDPVAVTVSVDVTTLRRPPG